MDKAPIMLLTACLLVSLWSYAQTEPSPAADSIPYQAVNPNKDAQDPIHVDHRQIKTENRRKSKKMAIDFIGYVKLIGGLDWGNVQNTSEFYPSRIPIYPTQEEEHPRAFLDARQTRLAVDGHYLVNNIDPMHVYVEIDFYNTEAETSFVPHLRQAYGEYKGFLLGQTWSTMKNNAAFPVQVDFEGPNSIPGPRNPMIRYTYATTKITVAGALESHVEDFTPYPENPDEAMDFQIIPDFIAYVQSQGRWGNIRLSGIARNISFTNKSSEGMASLFGWGAEISGIVKFWHRKKTNDDVRFAFTTGQGIAYYMSDLRGMGLDAAPDTIGDMSTIPVMGGYLAYKHAWNAWSTSSIIISVTAVDNADFSGDDLYKYATYGAVNYMCSPFDRLDFGVELIYGKHVNNIEDYGIGYRMQFMTIYHF